MGMTRKPLGVIQLGDSVDRNMHYYVQGFAGSRGIARQESVIPVEGGTWEGQDIFVMQTDRVAMASPPLPLSPIRPSLLKGECTALHSAFSFSFRLL